MKKTVGKIIACSMGLPMITCSLIGCSSSKIAPLPTPNSNVKSSVESEVGNSTESNSEISIIEDSEKDSISEVVFECDLDYENSTTTFTKKDGSYWIEYCTISNDEKYDGAFDSGPYGGKIDKKTYERCVAIIEYVKENREEFDRKAKEFSHLNYADKNADTLLNFAFSTLALSAWDGNDTEDVDEYRKENEEDARIHLDDIENIISHEDVTGDYVIYSSIFSSHQNVHEAIKSYFNEEDNKYPRVVDYDTYVATWNYYTHDAPLQYEDKDKEYVIYAYLGFFQNVDIRVDKMKQKDGKVDLTIYQDARGCMAGGNGALLVVPVEKGTEIGKVKFFGPVLTRLDAMTCY